MKYGVDGFQARKGGDKGGSFRNRAKSNDLSLTTGVGTIRFSAPEQLEGRGRYGLKVDNYACGIVLLEMFRNHDCPGRLIQDILNSVKQGKVEESTREKMPYNAIEIIEKLIQRNPDFRPSVLEILTSELLP